MKAGQAVEDLPVEAIVRGSQRLLSITPGDFQALKLGRPHRRAESRNAACLAPFPWVGAVRRKGPPGTHSGALLGSVIIDRVEMFSP